MVARPRTGSIVASVFAVAAFPFWVVVVTMGGLEIVQTVQGSETEHTPGRLALYALVPALLISSLAYAAWLWDSGHRG